ncbi:hypothetical protein DFO66_11475 [Brevibacterium sanguinis]|uniref:Peptidase S9 prolyl oligopeptidase catalytic domain-containing protein n=2 Tax=Brevibacterium TaxID=1696 RepID=A0A366IDV9_9MICO|nr:MULTISPECIES: alpha/beta hydrolase [Brevibacterium]RBP62567.1 hypothetical protein DFO66_11475 [Brevibacterium sanguinis]RBP69231.1 hypothetical protein DFO65_11475 [Brevibacterium celere]
MTEKTGTITTVTIENENMMWDLSADIHFPTDFDETKAYPAIVTAHPIGSCKEQCSGNVYAQALAEAGYLAIAFDAGFQGASGGRPRFKEDPNLRVADFSSVVDHLVTLDYVDADRIAVLGVCGGGGYALNAAMLERRFKAVVSITGVNYGRMMRETAAENGGLTAALEAIAAQRTAEARGAEPSIDDLLPPSPDAVKELGLTDPDLVEAVDYYKTDRGAAPHGCTSFNFATLGPAHVWDAFAHAETLLTQPLFVAIGDKVGAFGAYRDGMEIYHRAASTTKELLVLPDTTHYDLYDGPEASAKALERIIPFLGANL